MESLVKYIKNWLAIKEQKPCNEDLFVNEFICFLNTLEDENDVSFDGDGAYFGKQITINWNSRGYSYKPLIQFEIAYSENKIRVYNANHNGFWTPEYLAMTKDDARFEDVKKALFRLLYRVFGLPEKN